MVYGLDNSAFNVKSVDFKTDEGAPHIDRVVLGQ